ELQRRAARQVDHAGLGRAVGMRAGAAAQAGDRRGRNDRAAAGGARVRDGVLHAEADTAQQHRLGAVPVLDAGLLQRPDGAADAGDHRDLVIESSHRALRNAATRAAATHAATRAAAIRAAARAAMRSADAELLALAFAGGAALD